MSYSYSRLSVFNQCPYKHKLIYLDGNYISTPSIATDFGTLIHAIEEKIGISLKNKEKVDYKNLKEELNNSCKYLESKYSGQYYALDKVGRTYDGKIHFYNRIGINRLEKFMTENKEIEIIGLEEEFNFTYRGFEFHGFIDRLLKKGDTYIIEDIKTYTTPLEDKELKSPLQFVIYALAVQNKYNTSNIECYYDLPLCDVKQKVYNNFMEEGINKLNEELDNMLKNDIKAQASPLCHWCVFSATYPDQPEEAKGLCPYYSLWLPQNRINRANIKWQGEDKHLQIIKEWRKQINKE